MSHCHVQSFWYGDKLSPYELMCIRSFLSHGHTFDLYSYTTDLNVPAGCALLDAATILPEDRVFFYQTGRGKGGVSAFANLFRYQLLAETGGWWVDLDLVCLTDRLPDDDYVFGFEDDNGTINNAVLKVPREAALTQRCLDRALEIGADVAWGQTGTALLTGNITELGLGEYARPVQDFYPYSYTEASAALDPAKTRRLRRACRNSYCVHLWNEILRRRNVDKSKQPPPGSLIGHFMTEYGGL